MFEVIARKKRIQGRIGKSSVTQPLQVENVRFFILFLSIFNIHFSLVNSFIISLRSWRSCWRAKAKFVSGIVQSLNSLLTPPIHASDTGLSLFPLGSSPYGRG